MVRFLQKAASILDRPVDSRLICDCGVCATINSVTAFACVVCGYRGAPASYACSCNQSRDQSIRHLEGFRRESHGLDLGAIKTELRRLRAQSDQTCPPTPTGNADGNCCHGTHFCPVCEDHGDGSMGDQNARIAWEIIRDMRKAFGGVVSS